MKISPFSRNIKGSKNPNYKDGRCSIQKFCIECYQPICYNGKSGLCKKCVRKGSRNGFAGKTHNLKSKKKIGKESSKKFNRKYKNKIRNQFEGFKKKLTSGYIYTTKYNHPHKNSQGDVAEHRLVMEKYLKRYLRKKEEVHHIDGDKSNNKRKNLYLCKNKSEHMHVHNSFNKLLNIMFKSKIVNFKNGVYMLKKGLFEVGKVPQ